LRPYAGGHEDLDRTADEGSIRLPRKVVLQLDNRS